MSDPVKSMWDKLHEPEPEPQVDEYGLDPQTYPGPVPPKQVVQPLDTETPSWLVSLPSQEWLVNGTTRKFYTIGVLASVLQRAPTTIRSWESKGWIPPASFRAPAPRKEQIPGKTPKGRRLYSESQVTFLYEAYQRFNLADPKRADWASFRRHVKKSYPSS